MRLLVVGAGSTGGYFGGRLTQAGREVAFLVRPSRAEKLRETGLRIISPHGDATLRPQLVTATTIRGTYDAVLLAVKSFQLDAAVEDMAPAIGLETMILPVLNGMRHMDTLAEHFAPHNLMGCALKVSTTIDSEGRIVQLSPLQNLAYGELDGNATVRAHALDDFMQGAGFDARLSSSIRQEMWEKWCLLASLGGITCLMRSTIGEIEAESGGREFALAFLDEVVAIVRAVGIAPSDKFMLVAREQLTAKASPFTSSMYRDLQAGLPIEVEQIIGDLLRRGTEAGISTPLLSGAYTNLRIYQRTVAPK